MSYCQMFVHWSDDWRGPVNQNREGLMCIRFSASKVNTYDGTLQTYLSGEDHVFAFSNVKSLQVQTHKSLIRSRSIAILFSSFTAFHPCFGCALLSVFFASGVFQCRSCRNESIPVTASLITPYPVAAHFLRACETFLSPAQTQLEVQS